MNKKILSFLAISFCAGCGLFADEAVEAPAVETVVIEESTTACDCPAEEISDQQNVEEPIADCCGNKKKKKPAPAPADEPVACCGKCKRKPAPAPETVSEPVACCGTCEEAAPVKEEQEALAGCSCKGGKGKTA